MALPLRTFPQVPNDYETLKSDHLKRRALELIAQLKESPFLGQPLEYRGSVGNLGDCRKLYFDVSRDEPPRFRIVYRLIPDETTPQFVEVISIGERADAAIYREAARRLGR